MCCEKKIHFIYAECDVYGESTLHSWTVNTFIARYLNCQVVEFCVAGKHDINGPVGVFSCKN